MSTSGARVVAPGSTALVVVVVADSRTRTRALRGLLSGPGFVVAAEVCTAADAESAVEEHRPGAVLVDLDPADGGIEAIERIMGTRPTPVVVCGSLVEHSKAALAAGAVDVVGALDALPSSPQYATALRRHLRVASRVRVITHPRSRLRARGLEAGPGSPGSPGGPSPVRPASTAAHDLPAPDPIAGARRLVVVGASTGGPPALATILADLPPDLPVPVLVVQHMADGFVEGLADWLNGLSVLPVEMAVHGRRLGPGRVHVAPAGVNTVLRPGLRVELRTPPPGQFHVPGVDAAFTSAAAVCGPTAVGVLLTGMGRDGAEGLRHLHEAGALTIAQDEPSSVVWGMPAAALALGAVQVELPLSRIGAALAAAVAQPETDPRPVRS
ncbi:MAG TPA: chemotaxis protein CheB [Actinomycetes bacterium]|nr:chemotaxis protein CheB [Actinomycetes bacterium]